MLPCPLIQYRHAKGVPWGSLHHVRSLKHLKQKPLPVCTVLHSERRGVSSVCLRGVVQAQLQAFEETLKTSASDRTALEVCPCLVCLGCAPGAPLL